MIALWLLGLLYAALAIWRGPEDWAPAEIVSVDEDFGERDPEASAEESLPFPDAAAFSTIISNNLFSATRSPPPEKDGISGAAEAPSRDVSLVGIVEGGAEARALLRDRKSGEIEAVAIGASFKGWQLTSIEGDKAIIERDGEQIELVLRFVPEGAQVGIGPELLNPLAAGAARLPVMPLASDENGNPRRARRQEERRNCPP